MHLSGRGKTSVSKDETRFSAGLFIYIWDFPDRTRISFSGLTGQHLNSRKSLLPPTWALPVSPFMGTGRSTRHPTSSVVPGAPPFLACWQHAQALRVWLDSSSRGPSWDSSPSPGSFCELFTQIQKYVKWPQSQEGLLFRIQDNSSFICKLELVLGLRDIISICKQFFDYPGGMN